MSISPNTKPVVHARLDAAVLEQLRAVANRGDRSLSAEVRRAVKSHLLKTETKRETDG